MGNHEIYWDMILSFQTPKDEIGSEFFISIRPFNFRFFIVFLMWRSCRGVFLKHLVKLAATRTYQTSERMSWIAWLRLGIVTCLSQSLKNSRRVSRAKIWMKISGSLSVKSSSAFCISDFKNGLCLIDSIALNLLTLSNFYSFWHFLTTSMSIFFIGLRDLWR